MSDLTERLREGDDLLSRMEAADRIEELEAGIATSEAVHQNMLRGTIAKLTDKQFLHLTGRADHVIVPVEPTKAMLEDVGTIRYWEGTGFKHETDAAHIEWYKAMIKTAQETEQ